MTQEQLLQSRERARLQMMTARLCLSQDDKPKITEKETIGRKRLRDAMSADEKANMREKAKNTMNTMRAGMYPDKKPK